VPPQNSPSSPEFRAPPQRKTRRSAFEIYAGYVPSEVPEIGTIFTTIGSSNLHHSISSSLVWREDHESPFTTIEPLYL